MVRHTSSVVGDHEARPLQVAIISLVQHNQHSGFRIGVPNGVAHHVFYATAQQGRVPLRPAVVSVSDNNGLSLLSTLKVCILSHTLDNRPQIEHSLCLLSAACLKTSKGENLVNQSIQAVEVSLHAFDSVGLTSP